MQDEPHGTLKIAAPVSIGNQFLTPLVRGFMQRYTEANIELLLDDEIVDMVAENIDVSIRVGWLHDSSLIAKKLGDWSRFLCASPVILKNMAGLNHRLSWPITNGLFLPGFLLASLDVYKK